MAPTTILDESEAEWTKDFCYATLARMSLSELLYHVLTHDGSPVQITSTAKMHEATEAFPISIHRCAS
jgi:hypothetical protein